MFPINVNKRCPAIILAVSRTASVPGRIIFLIVSIHTIKGIKIEGVPWGTRWANMCCVWFNQPNIINEIHKGRAKVNVKVKCLVLVKIYGNNPKKLLNRISVNKDVKIKALFLFIGPIKVLNSLNNKYNNLFQIKEIREGKNQNV